MAPAAHWRLEALVAVVFLAVLTIVGGVALNVYLNIEPPVHTDAASVPSTPAAPPAQRYAGAVEQGSRLARTLLVDENLPGLSVAVAVDGQVVWAEGLGYANVERHAAVTPLTRFRTGSVSKTMTAAAVARLYERGRLDLDAPIQTYVPSYPRKPWTVTTRQLLGDIAGVHRIRGDNNDNVPRGYCKSLDDSLKSFDAEPLAFEPGTQYRFSTYGWILLSAVVEGAAGEPFSAFMTREVFTPLAMERTVMEGTTPDSDVASFYGEKRAFGVNQGVRDAADESYSCFFGAGAFLSTPSDLARLGAAMVKSGFLKKETIDLFQTPLRLRTGSSTGFALGWKVERVPLGGTSVRVVRHRATFFGGAVSLSVFPDSGVVVAVTTNTEGTEHVDPLALQLAEAFARTTGKP